MDGQDPNHLTRLEGEGLVVTVSDLGAELQSVMTPEG